jgi:DNA-directed RNA polymerase specialized sigma24 family protein
MPLELPERTPKEWMDLLRAHDQQAWTTMHSLIIWACNVRYGSHPKADREDAVSHLEHKLIQQLKDPGFVINNIKAYVFAAVAYYWRDQHRLAKPLVLLPENMEPPEILDRRVASPERTALLADLQACVDRLSEEDQQILWWYMYGCGPSQIAAWMAPVHITANAVGVRFFRMIRKVRNCLTGKGWAANALPA